MSKPVTHDILSEIAKRVSAEPKTKAKARHWRVLFGGTRQPSGRLWTYHEARKLAARYNRIHKVDTAYAGR